MAEIPSAWFRKNVFQVCDGGFRRRYQTKGEQISELEGYLAELKAEVQAVEERLADLRK